MRGRRDAQSIEPGLGEERLGATGVARAGESIHEPVVDQPVHEPRDTASRQQHAVGETAHPQPPPGCLGQLDERRVLLEREVVLPAEVLVKPARHLVIGAQEGAPRREARVAGGELSRVLRRGHRVDGTAARRTIDETTTGARSPKSRRRYDCRMSTFDVERLRAQFPALSLTHGGRPMAFFDGPGGTQVPASVIDAVATYYRTSNANHGGAFETSRRSDAIVEAAHAAVAHLLGADSADEVTFGQNMTSLTFHASRTIGATFASGDEIVVTGLDHEANIGPWAVLARERGLVLRTWEPRLADCTLDLDDLDDLLGPRTRLVAFGWASNAVGTINPVAEIVRRAHAAGAYTYVDAVHAAPHVTIDVQTTGTDFLACSVYKFFGPHVGALYVRRDVHAALPTLKIRPAEDHFETGTGNFEGYAGALAAVDYLATIGADAGPSASRRARLVAAMAAIRVYEMGLYRRLVDGLDAIRGVRVHGITDRASFEYRTPTAALTIAGLDPAAVAQRLGSEDIAVWNGDFYATGLIERLGLLDSGGVVRIGLTHYNTAAEVDRLLEALDRIAAESRSADSRTADGREAAPLAGSASA